MEELARKKCGPCEKKTKPFDRVEAERYVAQVDEWTLSPDATRISREFKFRSFVASVDFVNAVADIAEAEGHHPDIYVFYDTVRLEIWTHGIGGLSENDFIIAAKIDRSAHLSSLASRFG